jgi:transcriptional regulator with XRE-family HTH domain
MNLVLAKNVKSFRTSKHWTQQHLAETAGILLRTVQRVEEGTGREPRDSRCAGKRL